MEAEPHRKEMPQKGAESAEERGRFAELPADQDRGRAFQHVEEESERRELLAAGAQHIGGADIAGTDLPKIAVPAGLGQDQAEGYRPEQIADDESDDIDQRGTC